MSGMLIGSAVSLSPVSTFVGSFIRECRRSHESDSSIAVRYTVRRDPFAWVVIDKTETDTVLVDVAIFRFNIPCAEEYARSLCMMLNAYNRLSGPHGASE